MAQNDGAGRFRPHEADIISGAGVYFLPVIIAGFAFGTLRELVLVPTFGRAIGESFEAP